MKDCNSCGKCCIKYGNGGLSASSADIEGWALFNPEIYSYVQVVNKSGNIWFDPVTGKLIEYCPWLRKEPSAGKESSVGKEPSADKEQGNKPFYTCSIYHNRPEDCRHYPSTIAEMIRDECEMIEVQDLPSADATPKRAQLTLNKAQRALDKLMADSRPPFG